MKAHRLAVAVLVAAASLGSQAATHPLHPPHGWQLAQADGGLAAESPDTEFLLLAHRMNQQDMAAARLALARSRDVRVRQFAERVLGDHRHAARQLQRIAGEAGVILPAAPVVADARLQRLRGAAFDRRFVADARCAHRAALAAFREERANGHDAALVRYAADRLPELQQHLAAVQALHTQFELRSRNARTGAVVEGPPAQCAA